jgi:hypothetical protein
MIEYHALTLESKNDYRINNSTQALASLLSDYYKKDKDISAKFIKLSIEDTTNPIELLRKIEKGIR